MSPSSDPPAQPHTLKAGCWYYCSAGDDIFCAPCLDANDKGAIIPNIFPSRGSPMTVLSECTNPSELWTSAYAPVIAAWKTQGGTWLDA